MLCFFLMMGALLSACSSESKVEENITVEEITIADGWARPTKAGMMSAAYFTIKNTTDISDSLLSVSSNVSSNTQIHESYETEDGLMGMREQEFVLVPSKSEIQFKQGGLHIMIIQPDQDLIEGDSVLLGLSFSSSNEIKVKVPIRIPN